jgi:hypothetical protein
MSSSAASVSNTTADEIPDCGCRKPMRMFISNSDENPKQKYWKCAKSGVSLIAVLFYWHHCCDFLFISVDYGFDELIDL